MNNFHSKHFAASSRSRPWHYEFGLEIEHLNLDDSTDVWGWLLEVFHTPIVFTLDAHMRINND